uniref:hypothetical protein n=1 Tax=Roseivirga sp. TaxID=1964215 RepID=UPI0040481509
MKKLILGVTCVILYAMCLFSCVDEEVLPSTAPTIQSEYLKIPDDILKARFTKGLHYALSYKEARVKIKSAIMEQFDGDYNILFAQLKDERIMINRKGRNEELVFGELIMEGIDAPKESSDFLGKPGEIQTKSFLDSIADRLPLLQIAIPELPTANAEEWSAEEFSLPIAIVPETIVDDKVPVIGVDGTLGSLSATTPPEYLVMVISRNERVIALPKTNTSFTANVANDGLDCTGDPFLSTNSYDYVLIEDYYSAQNDCKLAGLPSSSGGGNSGSSSATCDRDVKNEKDILSFFKFNTIKQYRDAMDDSEDDEEWFGGGLDIHVDIIFGSANGSLAKLTKTFSGNRGDFRKCGFAWLNCDPIWYNASSEIVTWDKSNYGDAMLYIFTEYDGGSTTRTESYEFTSKINDIPVKFSGTRTFNQNDDILGQSIVEYCDNTDSEGYTYNTGKISFQVKQ